MKISKKIISALLTVGILLMFSLPAEAATVNGSVTVTNPYANVNWETYAAYKTALHNHTNASDGDATLFQSLERHEETGFDIISITDHGTVDYGWAEPTPNELIHGALSLVGKSEGNLTGLGAEGSFADGTTYTYGTAANGDDYITLSSGKQILRIPCGIENNAISANAHVNSWFVDFCDNSITTYEDAVKPVNELGGVCVINHPGEYTKARYEIRSEDAYNENTALYKYYADKFTELIEKYDACIGIDMNSKGDSRTRFDRILWDNLLERFAANGQNVYAIASSDAHQLSVIDTGYTLLLQPEQTSAASKSALLNGEFFAASHCIGNYDELADIAASLKEFYGETELYKKVNATVLQMAEKIEDIENGKYAADEDIGITYSTLDNNGYRTTETDPRISSITVDESEDTITINTSDALIVRWISNGNLIETDRADEAVLDLNEVEGLGNYVRAEVFGEGGIVYTQAFLINAEENNGSADVLNNKFVDMGFIDCLFAIFHNWMSILSRIIANLF